MEKSAELFIDTSGFNSAILAVKESGSGLATKVKFQIRQNWSERLPGQISALLKKAKIKLSEIKAIYVVKGPGSFSGTRTGVAFGNALSLALGVPVAGVKSTFDFPAIKKIPFKTAQGPVKPVYSSLPRISRSKKPVY